MGEARQPPGQFPLYELQRGEGTDVHVDVLDAEYVGLQRQPPGVDVYKRQVLLQAG